MSFCDEIFKVDSNMDQARSPQNGPSERLAVLTLALSMMLASLGTSIANVALPTLSIELSAPLHIVQWVVTAYLAALTFSVVIVGRLGDRFGLKRMLLCGLGLFSVASLICAIAPSLWILIAARAVQGFAAAFLMTLTIALVHETAGTDRIGQAMGLLGTMSALGTALGPSLGGFLISVANWSGVFLILVPFGLLGLVLAYLFLPAGQANAKLPKIQFRALRTKGLMPRLIANLFVAAVMMTTLIVGPFYLGFALGLSTASVGLVMSVGPVISIFSGVPSGRIVDLFGSHRVILIGLVALTLGASALAVLPEIFGIAGYLIAIAILTPGYQLFQAANNTAVMMDVTKDQRGVFSGLLSLSRNLGLVVGASGMGAVFALGTGTTAVYGAAPSSIANGMQLTFALAGILMIVAIYLVRICPSPTP